MTGYKNNMSAILVGITFIIANCSLFGYEGVAGLPIIKRDLPTGFANGGWKYDRYKDLQPLDANTRMVAADLKGPGIIEHFHTTRHFPIDLMARGIVLEIYFDDAEEPAVMCPLADFFGDGCNGKSMNFCSRLIECAPGSYNCYIPMPFKTRAKVVLRNDTEQNTRNYSYVEWEPLQEWKPELGYFHATYHRKVFQLTKDTDETFFHIKGCGHLIGRQYSIVTDEELFKSFGYVMEGNNEVDIDGRQRALDYLGTEDSFTFSWGFREPYAGLHAGMPFLQTGKTNFLSIYRFHDHMPIRFNRELRWHINWRHETGFCMSPGWAKAVAADGCWVDYATVYYWYQDVPAGYAHEPLLPLDQRQIPLLRHSAKRVLDVESLIQGIATDAELVNTISTPQDMSRIQVRSVFKKLYPFFIDQPQPKGGFPGNPNPGRRGILAVHPQDELTPCLAIRKVALPEKKNLLLRIVVSGDPYEATHNCDFLLQAGIHDGKQLTWFKEETIDSGVTASADNWKTLEYGLDDYAGKSVTIVLKVSAGGPNGLWANEEAFFDEISVVCK